MDFDSCYRIGYVIKRHGLKGDVKVHLESDIPKKVESIFVEIDNRLVPFFVEQISIHQDQAIVKLEEVDNPEQADDLARLSLYLPKASKPKSKSNAAEFDELLGCNVYTKAQLLGKIVGINNHALNPLLVVAGREKEILIPISDYFIKSIVKKTKRVEVELPDGFIEI